MRRGTRPVKGKGSRRSLSLSWRINNRGGWSRQPYLRSGCAQLGGQPYQKIPYHPKPEVQERVEWTGVACGLWLVAQIVAAQALSPATAIDMQ